MALYCRTNLLGEIPRLKMSSPLPPDSGDTHERAAAEAQAHLRDLERRIIWIWSNAVVVILSLTAALVSVWAYLLGLTLGLRALIALVLIFAAHMIYQHSRLRKTQRALAEHQIQAEVFRRMAIVDPLTGLYNRRFAEQRIAAEMGRSQRRGLSFIVVLLDLNDFKQINDKYGHAAGDLALKSFAELLSRSTRGSDLAVRWGGDEFMLLLLDCELDQLSRVLVRLDGFQIELAGKPFPIHFSVGWKAYEADDKLEQILEEADRNLYANKALAKEPRRPVPSPV
jgi:diguanylate cyclase (GGDEF)-like protein